MPVMKWMSVKTASCIVCVTVVPVSIQLSGMAAGVLGPSPRRWETRKQLPPRGYWAIFEE